jgi:hypothetical protein
MDLLRRILTCVLALAPFVAQADVCTVGAVVGRPDVGCSMERPRPVVAQATESCPYCHPASAAKPAPERPRPAGPTCCDGKPDATVTVAVELPGIPAGFEHPALAPVAPAPEMPVAIAMDRFDADVGRAPPGPSAPPPPSRAPPLG